MLKPKQLESMNKFGFATISGYYQKPQLDQLQVELDQLIQDNYNEEQLAKHAVYPSDRSEARISHAMMISVGDSEFPRIDPGSYAQVNSFLNDQNLILSELTGTPVKASSRSLLNFQNYLSGSKPVGEHFDGEYLKASKEDDGIEFRLLEGILPRYVGVLVVENHNDGKGVEFIDHGKGEVYTPKLHGGDLVIFDNINLRHRVPSMDHPRISIGLRNFDHVPLHFARNAEHYLAGADYRSIPEGFVSENADCHQRLKRYLSEEWPAIKHEYSSYV